MELRKASITAPRNSRERSGCYCNVLLVPSFALLLPLKGWPCAKCYETFISYLSTIHSIYFSKQILYFQIRLSASCVSNLELWILDLGG